MTSKNLLLLIAVATPCAFGYIGETVTSGSQTVQINRPDSASLQFYLNSGVVSGAKSSVSNTTVIAPDNNPTGAVQAAMAVWNNAAAASGANINFAALQSTAAGHDSSDCKNVISIGSSADLSVLGFVSAASPGLVGVTVNFTVSTPGAACGGNVAAGAIIDSDILLNPYMEFSTDHTANTKDLQGVITHEFGHVLGMNHSQVLSATMFPFAASYDRRLGPDEKAFAAATYPLATTAATFATVSGTVTLSGAPIAYGFVTLIDQTKGKVVGTLTSATGTYSFQVAPGTYNVYAEPFNSLIGPANIYAVNAAGSLGATPVTTAFEPTFFGTTASPTAVTATAGATSTANIAVTPGASALSALAYAAGGAGKSGDIATFNGAGAVSAISGQSFDFAIAGTGIDSTATFLVFGNGLTVGTPRVDASGTINGLPIIRVTVTTTASNTASQGSLWIVKGSNIVALSGVLDIEPTTPTVNNVLPLYSSGTAVTSGQFATVYGANLAASSRVWNANTDFTGGTASGSPLPTSLDGVTVTVNNIPAAVYSVDPAQVNFIVPSSLASGSATVVVSNGGTVAATFTGTSTAQASPSFFVYGPASPYYVSAYHANYTLVGDPAVVPGSTKAQPGEEVFLYATGLAPAPGGTVITASEFSQTPVTVTAGTTALTVAAGSDGKLAPYLIVAGLFQVNVIVPATMAAGNYNLTMTVPNGTTASSGISVILPVGP